MVVKGLREAAEPLLGDTAVVRREALFVWLEKASQERIPLFQDAHFSLAVMNSVSFIDSFSSVDSILFSTSYCGARFSLK
jgi:hypothetical protein